jgi:hypothetical protein
MPHHPDLERLYAERARLQNSMDGSQKGTVKYRAQVHAVAFRIHNAEATYGKQPQRFRRCVTCFRLHAAAVRGCDGNGRYLFEIWASYGPDRVFVED